MNEQELAWLRRLISDYSGLDTSTLASNALQRAVAQRLAAQRLDNLAEYWPLLASASGNGDEMIRLVQLLTNKETYLFRESHHFEVLSDRVLPELLARGHRPLRLWSAGCSTGEEAYSLAITLLEYQAHHGTFAAEIVATDIDEQALAVARRGCYGQRSLRLVPENLRRRYFQPDGQQHCLVPEVGRWITFQVYNLAERSVPPLLLDLDVIFCRNVTIYFSPQAREQLNARLAASLREGGYLFVASAETMGHNQGRLELVSHKNVFLFHKGQRPPPPPKPQRSSPPPLAGPPRPLPTRPFPAPSGAGSSSAVPAAPSAPPLQRAYQAFLDQDYAAALGLLDRLALGPGIRPEIACLRAAVLLQQERLDEAEDACQQVLVCDPWHANAHFLMGFISRLRNQVEDAVQALKQAIYLQPDHQEAHFLLAEIYRALGLRHDAQREYENTLNILRSRAGQPSTPGLTGLPDDTLRRACESNLGNLSPGGKRSA